MFRFTVVGIVLQTIGRMVLFNGYWRWS